MPTDKWQTRIFRAALLLCGASLVLVLSLTGWHLHDKNQVVNSARNIAQEKAVTAAAQIEKRLSKIPIIAQKIASDLASGTLQDRDVEDRLIRELAKNPQVSAITACYAPDFVPDFAPQAHRNRYCPFSYRNADGDIVIVRTEDSYDYTVPDGSIGPDGEPIRTFWYHRPLAEGPVWSGDFYSGTAVEEYWTGFGVPFFRKDVTPPTHPLKEQAVDTHPFYQLREAGIIDVSFTLAQFQELAGLLDLEKPEAGYGFILSEIGKFISHPINEFVKEGKTISDFDESLSIGGLWALAENGKSGQIAIVDHVDKKSGRSSWVFFTRIPSARWWVGIVLDKEVISRSILLSGRLRQQQAGIAMGMLAFLFFLSVLLFRVEKGTNLRLWAVSASLSFLCATGLGYLWISNTTGSSGEDLRDIMLVDRAITEKVVADYSRDIIDPIYIPTGVFIQSMDFTTAHEVLFTGYIWQKYSKEMPDWVRPEPGSPGFVLPQEISASRMVTEAYRQKEGDQEVIGWNVRAILRQEFDYSRYPFHREDIGIRIWHKDFSRRVILTPDLVSYANTAPDSLPGTGQDFFLEGWDVDRVFFSYRENIHNTNFGIPSYAGQQEPPELFFHVSLTRQFVDAFISHIIPLAVVAVLLFAVLVIITRREERIKAIGLSTAGVLAYCAALFFVVILSHINLRSGLEAPERIVYLEYLYFLLYATILVVSVNSILFASRVNIWLIQSRDNVLVAMLFWPVFLTALLVITLVVFL